MTAFFNQLRRAKLELKEEGEDVSDAYLLRAAWNKIRGKHDKLDDAISKLRTQAGVTGIPTTLVQARNVLEDIFDFEVPMSVKTEKPPAEYAKILADLTPGMSGAQIANIVNEAALLGKR